MVTDRYSAADYARFVPEPAKQTARSPFSRDRARVLHSVGLRRLAAKTQVMVAGVSDFPRTRLTHTLEVAQIARELGDALGCNADLVDVAGLTHDLGHPPFGHNGEDELDRLTDHIGGFEGNAQTLRVLTRLEAKVLDPLTGDSAGLNLTRASLDASCKYPWQRKSGMRKFGAYADDLDVFGWLREGALGERTCLEEQVMDWSDDVAYSVHDAEDAIYARLLTFDMLRSPIEQAELVRIAHQRYAPQDDPAELDAAMKRLVSLEEFPATDFDGTTRDLVALKRFTSTLIGRFCVSAQIATQVKFGDGPLVRYDADLVVPDEVRAEVSVMKAVAVRYVMNREGADEIYARQRAVLAELVEALAEDDGRSLESWIRHAYEEATTDDQRLRVIVDQVASLTDTTAIEWHRQLTGGERRQP